MALGQTYFDSMFKGNDDPWGFQSRWYESRKRALTLASLPQAHYEHAFEPGCANGELSAALASRCSQLLCMDGTRRAVELATERLKACMHVTVQHGVVPEDWPLPQDARFDLIVFSELGYFLTPASLDAVAQQINESLVPGGTLVACHWRRPIGGCDLNGDEVHTQLIGSIGAPHALTLLDDDFRLDVWFGDGRSVGELQGLVESQ
jgi:SAM-dependent methyltransferase